MNLQHLILLLQINGGTFPSGGFSQSFGLETYVSLGKIRNGEQFSEFLHMYIDAVVARSECPIALEAMKLTPAWRVEEIRSLEDLSLAAKLTRESRLAALRSGKAFLRIVSSICKDTRIQGLYQDWAREGMSYSVAYGLFCGSMGIRREDAAAAFIFNTANALVQSAIKLVPLGNVEGQQILAYAASAMEKAVILACDLEIGDVTNFAPGLDIAGMDHETLSVRLFMT